MGGGFSAGGLITGIDSGQLIRQIIQLERQPILRFENRIEALEEQQEAVGDLRTALQTLRNAVRDFQITSIFQSFQATVSTESVLSAEVTGSNPASGSFTIDVQQLATATVATSSARLGAAINPAATLDTSGIRTSITAGSFTINGVQFNVDPATQTLDQILAGIAAAGITATYDPVSDTVNIENATPGDTSIINFGANGDTSNFLEAIGVTNSFQFTNGNGATQVNSDGPLGTIATGEVLNTLNFGGGAITGGAFNINGVSIAIDPTTDTLNDIISRINDSDAGVSASFDSTTDTIRVVSESLGSRTISFSSGTSNFLDIANLTTANQTAGVDAQYTVNGGPVISGNSNTITGAIPDVTLNLLSTGTTQVTISDDNDSILEEVQGFVTDFNEAVSKLAELTGEDGALENDFSIETINNALRGTIFSSVSGLSGSFDSLLNLGFSSGESFDPGSPFELSLDTEEFLEALAEDRGNVSNLFTNESETGIFDQLFDYLDSITATDGFLNERAKSGGTIDSRIDLFRGQIESLERRIDLKEQRLRAQFSALETTVNSLQQQGSALGQLGGGIF